MWLGGDFVGGDVTIRYGYNAGVTLYVECQFVVVREATATLAVDSSEADMLQVDAVSLPVGVVRLSNNFDWLTVNKADETACNASISTPVFPSHSTFAIAL